MKSFNISKFVNSLFVDVQCSWQWLIFRITQKKTLERI